MRASFKLSVAAAALMLLSAVGTANAGWYSARGTAPIVNGDVAAARKNAVDDALRNATLQAGVDVTISQESDNGILTANRISLHSRSPARHVRVIEEQENGKIVTVLIKALIDESLGSHCYAGNIRKIVMPLAVKYKDSEASSGAADIMGFESYINDLLYEKISLSPSLYLLPVNSDKLQLEEGRAASPYSTQRSLDALSKRTAAQFLIAVSLNSAAKSQPEGNFFDKMLTNPVRTLRFNVKVYDLYSGLRIFDRNYEGDAEWTYEKGAQVSLRTDRFRSSDYGQRSEQLVNYAVNEVISLLKCRTPMGRIIQLTNDAIRINIGGNSNIKEGMYFDIIHRADYTDRHTQQFFESNSTNGLYKVSRVSADSAWLIPADESSQVINVMLDDIVTLAKEKDQKSGEEQ